MSYLNGLSASIKVKGEVAREIDGVVYLPFGTEYSLHFTNSTGQKATAKVKIDGADVLDGRNLLIPAYDRADLHGFLNGLTAHNSFKFIRRSAAVEQHRGVRPKDGTIEIEFQFERPPAVLNPWKSPPNQPWYSKYPPKQPWYPNEPVFRESIGSKGSPGGISMMNCCSFGTESSFQQETKTCGISVPGTPVDQSFNEGSIGSLDPTIHKITLFLSGETSKEVLVQEPRLVQTKVSCPTCGRKNKSCGKYCSECGTCLI